MSKIAIIERESKEVVWQHALDKGQECNSVIQSSSGDILYSYRWGAKLINMQGEVLFDFKIAEKQEVQSVTEIKGGYLIGVCGTPARLVELNTKGEVVKEVKYDTKLASQHGQFRQICKSHKGTYLIPLLGRNSIVEVDDKGNELREIAIAESPFSITTISKNRWIVPCGHSGVVFDIDSKKGESKVLFSNSTIEEGVNIEFAAQTVQLRNGNYLLANWLGHNGDQTQPMLMEVDSQGNVVWKVASNPDQGVSLISAVQPLYKY